MYNVNVNVSLMVENVIQTKSGITKNVGSSVKIQKNIVCAKKIICNPATYTCEIFSKYY